jgi:hypothetical protein
MSRRAPLVLWVVALFFALSGAAIAATHYLITSTNQIEPSVLSQEDHLAFE